MAVHDSFHTPGFSSRRMVEVASYVLSSMDFTKVTSRKLGIQGCRCVTQPGSDNVCAIIFRNGLWYISSQLPPQYMQSQLNEELTAHLVSWTSRRTCAQVAPLLRNLRFASLPPTTSPGKHTMLPTGHAMATDSHYDLSDDMT